MTLTLGPYRITLFKIERLTRFIPQIDQAQRTQQAQAYKAGKV